MSIFGAEVIGTAILVVFGNGVVAGELLTLSKSQNGGWIIISFGWGMGVAFAVFAVAAYSGAHINPAVTLGFAVIGTTEWSDVPKYLAGQFVGACLGATLVYAVYYNHWRETEDAGLKLACFSTGPSVRNVASNFVTEFIATFLLLFITLALVADEALVESGLAPFIFGFLVFAIVLTLGGATGTAINPARDLGPRIMHAILPIAGKGSSDWDTRGFRWPGRFSAASRAPWSSTSAIRAEEAPGRTL